MPRKAKPRKKIARQPKPKKRTTRKIKTKRARPRKRKAVKEKRTVRKSRRSRPLASVEFCGKCGSILIPIKGKKGAAHLKCRSCGRSFKKTIRNLRIVEEQEHSADVAVLEKDSTLLPITEQECPKCTHQKAAWWMQQTREADEPPTQFFRCEKCKHVWREYK